MVIVVQSFSKNPFSKCIPSTLKPKAGVSNCSVLKSAFEKLPAKSINENQSLIAIKIINNNQ